jgi:hypothetical protein
LFATVARSSKYNLTALRIAERVSDCVTPDCNQNMCLNIEKGGGTLSFAFVQPNPILSGMSLQRNVLQDVTDHEKHTVYDQFFN